MLEKVKETVAEALGADIDTITAETSFKEDLGADSLDLFEMVMSLGNCRCQMMLRHPGHAALNDWILNPE